MKHVVTYCLREGEGKTFQYQLAIGKQQDPEIVIKSLLIARNRTRIQDTEMLFLVDVLPDFGVSYKHDWEKYEGDLFKCADCGVRGRRDNPLQPIRPLKKNPMFKDCGWAIE